MKKIICFLFFIYGISAFANNGHLMNDHKMFLPPGDSVQVFLGISHNDETNVSAIRSALNSIPGVTILAYCNSHAVFMLYVNTNQIRSEGEMLIQLKNLLPKQASLLSIKGGITFSDFYKNCQPSDPNEAKSIKQLN